MNATTKASGMTDNDMEKLKALVPNSVIETIDLDDICVNPVTNTREINGDAYTDKSIGELADQIEAVGGLLYPLTVYEIEPDPMTDNKKYLLHVGFRRAMALRKLVESGKEQFKTVKAIILDGEYGGAALTAVQLLENIGRRDLTPMEKSNGIEAMLSDPEAKLTQNAVAKFFGISAVEVSNLRKLQNFPKEIQDKIANETLLFSFARVIARDIDQADWPEWVKKAESGMTIGKFEEAVKEYKDKKNPPAADDKASDGSSASSSSSDSSPRATKTVNATVLKETFVPFLEQRVKAADATEKKFTAAEMEQYRLDAVLTVLMEAKTKLNEEITPFMQKQEEEKAKREADKDAMDAKEKFLKDLVKQTEAVYEENMKPDPANPEKVYKLSTAMGVVLQRLMELPEEKVKELGFPLVKDVNAWAVELSKAYQETLKDRREKAEKAKKRKQEKAAAEKQGAADGQAAAATAAANEAK